MTQIQSENSNTNTNSIQSKNQPSDLSSIYEALTKLTQSNPSYNNNNKSITVPSPLSLIALTCHAFLISNSFCLNPSSTQPFTSDQDPSLRTDWNTILSPSQHSLLFSYSHPQSSFSFEFTFSKIGNHISIAGVTVQDDRLSTWHILTPEYVEPTQFPINLTIEQQKDSNGFRSSTHLLNFISLFVNKILNQLLPDIFPITSHIQRSAPSITTNPSNSNQQTWNNSQQVPSPPAQPNNPIQAPIIDIGRSDLEPIGTTNLGIPSLYNRLPRPGFDQPTGMMIHPNHPIFRPPSALGQPESFHPLGARFDPIGPNFPRPRPNPGFDLDPMGGLGQGLPLQNPHLALQPNRNDFNEFRPPGPSGSGYDDMFMCFTTEKRNNVEIILVPKISSKGGRSSEGGLDIGCLI